MIELRQDITLYKKLQPCFYAFETYLGDCTVDSCMGIYYQDYSKQDLERAIVAAFELDDYVKEVISRSIRFWLSEEDNASEN